MKRPVTAAAAVIIILTLAFLSGCPGTIKPAPGPKTGQEAPKPQEKQLQEQKPPEQKAPAAKPGLYFPLALGSSWAYQGEGNEYATFSREVIFASGSRAQMREDNGGTVMAMIYEITDEAVTRIFSKGEVYERVNLLNSQPSEKIIILKSPLEVGTKWKDPNGEREIVDLKATVATPAGKFENCIKVKIAGKDSTVYEYFKDGVGMVKREFISGEARVSSSLKKFTPGKG